MKKVDDINYTPVTASEEIVYQMLIRLDALCNMTSALCNMTSSLVEHIATKDGVATESVTQVVTPTAVTKKKTKK